MSKKEKKARSLRQILLSALGKAWMFWPPRLSVKKRCKHPTKPGWYICELNQSHVVEKIDVDHIKPCIRPSDGFISWDDYIASRFVEDSKLLQGLCTACHKEKSKKENEERRRNKQLAKVICSHDDSSWCTEKCPKKTRTSNSGETITFNG